jgi:transcriptional regulator of acetoin/glycerol metabolism
VLQEHEVLPVGATTPVKVDLRVIAATHRDLDALSEAGQFRRDLLARLAGHIIRLPALRERREDLGLLVATLLQRLGASSATLTAPAARALFRYGWPSNIRELEKCLESATVLANGSPLLLEHLPEKVAEAAEASPAHADAEPEPEAPVAKEQDLLRRSHLVDLLRSHRGNVSAVARALGTSRTQVHRWVKRFRLDPDSYR